MARLSFLRDGNKSRRVFGSAEKAIVCKQLAVFGDESAVSDQSTVGVLGGTGPLSDANIVRLVMARLDPADVASGTMLNNIKRDAMRMNRCSTCCSAV